MRSALVVLLMCGVALAQKPAEVTKSILDQANAYRVKKDAGKLVGDDTLNAIAQAHARALAKADKYGDDDKNGHILDGKTPLDRVKAGGYKYARFAENVGYNFGMKDPASKMMKDWIASPPHEKNLLNADFTQTGIGAARGESGRWYFVQLFGKPLGAVALARVEVAIENRTKQTIPFTIGTKKYELKPGQKATFTHQSTGKIEIGIAWPGRQVVEAVALSDKARYALAVKDGSYVFEKVGR